MKGFMSKTVCSKQQCSGCAACAEICPRGAIELMDRMEFTEAVIDYTKCVECGLCYSVCPNHTRVEQRQPITWHQGWRLQEDERQKSSSGGAAAAVSEAFIRSGGVVCSCVQTDDGFGFSLAETLQDLDAFRGSRYVKSSLKGVYRKIRKCIQDGRRVLFIGLPCQVAALKNYVGEQLQEHLTTVDLICHGTPSVKLLKRYLEEKGHDLQWLPRLEFRKKNHFALRTNSNLLEKGVQDNYTFAFLRALTYTENCYSCPYAAQQRAADITLGDSWGSTLTEEIEKGISLILCQTEKGRKLLNEAGLELMEVDVAKATASNQQLRHPAMMPAAREKFFRHIQKGRCFDAAVALVYPYTSAKRLVKKVVKNVLSVFAR